MSKCFLGLLAILFSNILAAQELVPLTDSARVFMEPPPVAVSGDLDDRIFTKVESEAEFPGGLDGWRNYLQKNLKADIPARKGAPNGRYDVVIQFIVDKDGSISGIQAVTKIGYGMEDEVIRIIKKSPKWIPAQQNGRTVKAYRKQPITFIVQ